MYYRFKLFSIYHVLFFYRTPELCHECSVPSAGANWQGEGGAGDLEDGEEPAQRRAQDLYDGHSCFAKLTPSLGELDV